LYLDLYKIGMSFILRQDNSKNELEDKFNKYFTLVSFKRVVRPKNRTHLVLYSPSIMKQVYLINTSGNKTRLIPNGASQVLFT